MSSAPAKLERIAQLTIKREWIEAETHALALAARQEGATWTEIGRALQISPQAAQQRYRAKQVAR